LVDSSLFPRYLEPFAPERIKEVPPPTRGVVARPEVQRARASVVKILGSADSCGRSLEGSGFVFQTGRVMTNAHVVAGVEHPEVVIGETQYDGTVVYYDPDVDVAVIAVPDLPARPLSFATEPATTSDPAAVLGYPENGPFNAQPARIRDKQTLRSPNIYGDDTVYRDTYSIRALVRQGNSGGPLVDTHGNVLGVIFAASVTDGDTGYALTADQVSDAAQAGGASQSGVDTGDCAA
jgi:S1-C subfamily serine protease